MATPRRPGPALLLSLLALAAAPPAAPGIDIPDPNLEARMRAAAGVFDRELTAADLAGITELRAFERGINDLTGIGHLVDLATLDLEDNRLRDIGPLAGLTRLRELDIGDNDVVDLAPLAGLANLEVLRAGGNDIVDLRPLTGLNRLREAWLGFNDIDDITPLAGMGSLRWVSLASNPIPDFSPLSGLELNHLDLRSLGLDDLRFITGLVSLQSLTLTDNRIEDLEHLEGLVNLEDLSLGQNRIWDLTPLSGLGRLRYLSLYGNLVENLSPLIDLQGLWHLTLTENRISDVSALAEIGQLRSLSLSNNAIDSIRPLAQLDGLSWIYIDRNFIDLGPGSAEVDAVLALETSGTTVYSDPQHPVEVVTFSDPDLEREVRDAIGGAGGGLTTLDLARLYELSAESKEIDRLDGIEHAIYLDHLKVGENRIDTETDEVRAITEEIQQYAALILRDQRLPDPTTDPTAPQITLALLPADDDLALPARVQLSWHTATGLTYQLRTSADLRTWQDLGGPVAGTGQPVTLTIDQPDGDRAFFGILCCSP